MKIILAQSAGFCFGVKRATQMAFEAADQNPCICSLGPIIHSPQLVERLEGKGVRVVREVSDVEGGAVIIRSHGVTAQVLDELKGKGLDLIDATCPFVQKAQEHAEELSRDGYAVVIVGEKEHPEVAGILSWARHGEAFVVADAEEAGALGKFRKLGLVAQTTQSYENLNEIVGVCLGKAKELRVFNTICNATTVRQEEARQIAQQVDLMLVVGGYNSANTTRLAHICAQHQSRTHHVETAEEIDPAWFGGVNTVGVTAGASTPRWIIDEVLARIEKLEK